MDALIPLAGGLALLAAPPAQTASLAHWRPIIEESSVRFGVPRAWIERVMAAESGGHTALGGRPIRSQAGAIGLMQLMPQTWAKMRDAEHLGRNPDDPRDNILAGTAYLRRMYDRFGYPGMFAAYNAGPERYAAALATGRRLPAETLAYLATVTGVPRRISAPLQQAAMQRLFVVRHDQTGDPTSDTPSPAAGLFVAGGNAASGP